MWPVSLALCAHSIPEDASHARLEVCERHQQYSVVALDMFKYSTLLYGEPVAGLGSVFSVASRAVASTGLSHDM